MAFNVIAGKRMACLDYDRDRYDRTRHVTVHEKNSRHYDKDGRHYYDNDCSPEDENARDPLQAYGGVSLAIPVPRRTGINGQLLKAGCRSVMFSSSAIARALSKNALAVTAIDILREIGPV